MANEQRLKQESFVVNSKVGSVKKIVRQDRWHLAPGTACLVLQDTQLQINNISAFGVAAYCDSNQGERLQKLMTSSDTLTADLIFNGIEVQSLSLRPVRLDPVGGGSEIIAFETISEPICIERCKAIEVANEIVSKQKTLGAQAVAIPPAFRGLVYEMQAWLQSLKVQLDQIESNMNPNDLSAEEEFKTTIAEVISGYLNEYLPKAYQVVPSILAGLNSDEKEKCFSFARVNLGPLIFGAPFANRAFYKPLGYAGDYEMMNHIYRNEPVGRTFFDQCMHKYFVDEPAAQAVKNRGEYLFNKLRQLVENTPSNQPIKIISIASGPALEQQLFIERLPQFYGRPIELHCLDQDEISLKHAQRKLLSLARMHNPQYKFKFHHLAIKNVIAQGLPEDNFDLVYSAGLFDYFSEPVAQAAGNKFLSALKANGTTIIGNFSKDNPSIPFMEMLLDWILIYRSLDDMNRIFAPLSKNLEVEFEPLKINLFAVLRRT